MEFWLDRFRRLDVTKQSHRKMLIDTFVNAMYLYDDKILITFNYKEGTKIITFSDVQEAVNSAASGSDLDCLSAPYRVFITDLTVVDTRFSFFSKYHRLKQNLYIQIPCLLRYRTIGFMGKHLTNVQLYV